MVSVLCSIFISIFVWSFLTVEAQDYTCDLLQDSCEFRDDFECDQNSACSQDSDCFDCNYFTCHKFSYDCEGCLDAPGCYWCPEDAQCYNSADYGLNPPDYATTPGGQDAYYLGRPRETECKSSQNFLSGESETQTCSRQDHFFSDPLYSSGNWVFEMINVTGAWEQGFTGNGVRVRINDDGVGKDHIEFSGRYDSEGSCDLDGPTGSVYDGIHGTTVASIVAAAAGNNECSVGVAPNATISSCNVFEYIANSPEVLVEKLHSFDISQNSWQNIVCYQKNARRLRNLANDCPFESLEPSNPCGNCSGFSDDTVLSEECEDAVFMHCANSFTYQQDTDACNEYFHLLLDSCEYHMIRDYQVDQIERGAQLGRNGKGAIYVVSSGNYYHYGVDVNMDRLTNTRFTIAVGAVGKDELHSSFSNPGAALFVTAPGGDVDYRMNIPVANVEGGCRDSDHGTSFSAPIVSGVIALMLEANPSLGWRDVQAILAATSRMVIDPNDKSRVLNIANYSHSNLYGFGIVDAGQAVSASLTWKNLGPEKMATWESGQVNAKIDENGSQASFLASVDYGTGTEDLIIESISVQLELQHASRGDLEIVLTSPSGVQSVLHPGNRKETTMTVQGEFWKLLTVRNYGEKATGTWRLSIRDLREGNVDACSDFHLFLPEFSLIGCSLLEIAACKGGELNPAYWYRYADDDPTLVATDAETGLTLQQSCCACGGGTRFAEVTNALRSWNVVFAGHVVGLPGNASTGTFSQTRTAFAVVIGCFLLAMQQP